MSKFKVLKIIGKYFSFDRYRRILDFLNHYVIGLLKRIDNHHIFLTGGGIAFSIILSSIPIMLIIFAVLGNFIDPETIKPNVSKLINTIIPYPEYANYTTSLILRKIPDVFQYTSSAFYLGLAGLFFTATWLFSSMRTILNRIFITTKVKGIIFGLVKDILMVFLILILVLVATFVLPSINIFLNATENVSFLKDFQIGFVVKLIFSLISFLIVLFLFFLFYTLIPYEKLNKKITFVGALWATILWELARYIFGYYVQTFLSSNKFYEAFLLILVILFWLFYSSILFIVGAEIAQLYRERLDKKSITDRKL